MKTAVADDDRKSIRRARLAWIRSKMQEELEKVPDLLNQHMNKKAD